MFESSEKLSYVIIFLVIFLSIILHFYKRGQSVNAAPQHEIYYDDLLFDKWTLSYQLGNEPTSESLKPDTDESIIENIHRILLTFNESGGYVTLILDDSEQFLQAACTNEKGTFDQKAYYVEYRHPHKEILYRSVEKLSLEKTMSLFQAMINEDPDILNKIDWKDTEFFK